MRQTFRPQLCLASTLAAASLLSLFQCPVPAAGATAPVEVRLFDARYLNTLNVSARSNAVVVWDTMHCVAALQGLANRERPRLYMFYSQGFGVETDSFWLDWLQKKDGWLRETRVTPLRDLDEAISVFRPFVKGLVVYDENVPATANLASTAAGCEGLLPARFDPSEGSLFNRLIREFKFDVKLWLVQTNGAPMFTGAGTIPGLDTPSTGSAKTDACLWGLHRWVRSGMAAPALAAYFMDAYWLKHPHGGPAPLHTLSNHDYFIAKKAFFFDLSPWGDEPPNDDPGQPAGADKKMFLQVMREIYDREPGAVITVGGFIPWPHKYTNGSQPPGGHDAVLTEWEFGLLISQFNGYMEADAAGLSDMSNASFYRHYPLKKTYPQKNSRPSKADWVARGLIGLDARPVRKLFVGHYVGDYDAPAWLYKAVPVMFPNKAATPLGWAFDPNLADRAPQAMAYARANAGSNDWFIAGDSGAGYLNPRALTIRPQSALPSGLEAWVRHCEGHYRRWDISITGFVLDGSAGQSTDLEFTAYRSFSRDGIGTHFEKSPAIKAGIPTCPERDLPDKPESAAAVIAEAARGRKGETSFLWCRSILKDPRWYDQVSTLIREKHPDVSVEIVDPYTFFGLIKLHIESSVKD